MSIHKQISLIIYVIFIVLLGIIFVPYKMMWGPENEIMVADAKFAPLWFLIDKKNDINGFNPIYELQIARVLYTIFIVTLIFGAIFLLFSRKNK